MASYDDIETYIKNSVELEDTKTVALMNPAINFGIWLAVVLFEPDDQKQISDLTAVSTANYISHGLTRFLRLDHIYNQTGAKPMWPMSYDQIRAMYSSGTSAEFYALYGGRLYYAPTPSSNETINAHFLQYPARIGTGENLPFADFEDFITSTAIRFVWATQEETENVDMWGKIVADLSVGGKALTTLKQIMEREGVDVNNLSRVIPKGTPPS